MAQPTSIHFPGQGQDETVQFYFRQHWIRLARPLGKMLLWLALLMVGLAIAPQITAPGQDATRHVLLLLLCSFLIFSQLEFLMKFYHHFLHVIIITDRKIHRIKKTLFVIDDHQSIDVSALQDVHKSQRGIVQNMFGFGTLTLEAQESVLRIHFVPDIAQKYHEILRLRGWSSGNTQGAST